MKNLIDDYIAMNQAGQVLALCEKYYDENVLMLNNGVIFAESMREAFDKQKGFIESVKAFEVNLVDQSIENNSAELTFHYKMTGADGKVNEFTGKHIQTWQNQKIIKEQYLPVN